MARVVISSLLWILVCGYAASEYCEVTDAGLLVRLRNITVFQHRLYTLPKSNIVLEAPALKRPVNTRTEEFGDVTTSCGRARLRTRPRWVAIVTMSDTSQDDLVGSLDLAGRGTIDFAGTPVTGGFNPGSLAITGGTGNFSFASGLVTRTALSFDGATLVSRVEVCYTRFPFVLDPAP